MKLVIDIPEGMLDELRTCKFPIQDAYRLCVIIENGKPLPKGHGDLKDASKMIADLNTVRVDNYAETIEWACNVIDSYPTIIEADEEGAEE